jgi:hypothetical protein
MAVVNQPLKLSISINLTLTIWLMLTGVTKVKSRGVRGLIKMHIKMMKAGMIPATAPDEVAAGAETHLPRRMFCNIHAIHVSITCGLFARVR